MMTFDHLFDLRKWVIAAVALLLATLIVVSNQTSSNGGGSELGNGGQVIKCITDAGPSFQFYDPVEAVIYSPNYKMADELRGLTRDKAMDRLLRRLKHIDPKRVAKYRSWWLSFWDETTLLAPSAVFKLSNTQDRLGGLDLLKNNCEIINVAFQHTQKFHSRYLIDRNVFNSLSQEDQFLLILHEIIYRDMISLGITRDSRNVRYLTTYFSSKQFFQESKPPVSKSFASHYFQTLEDQRIHKPWLHPRYLRFVTYLYSTILDRSPEGDSQVVFWARECQKYGVTHVVNQFLDSREYKEKLFDQRHTIRSVRKISGIDTVSSPTLGIWHRDYKINKSKANKALLHSLIPRGRSCFDFIGTTHPELTNENHKKKSLALEH